MRHERVFEGEKRIAEEWFQLWVKEMAKMKLVPSKNDILFARRESEVFAARKVVEIVGILRQSNRTLN